MASIDLSGYLSAPARVDAAGELRLDPALSAVAPQYRRGQSLNQVWCDGLSAPEDAVCYIMHRDVAHTAHRPLFQRHRVRYDITVILPGAVGLEYNKTLGHYHPEPEGAGCTYPEVYQVLSGQAGFLLQERGASDDTVSRVVFVAAGPGQVLVVPPGFGHVSVNTGTELLVLSNLVCPDFSAQYGPYLENRGAACYINRGPGGPELAPNPRYRRLPRAERPPGGPAEESIYTRFVRDPEHFCYLAQPREFAPQKA